MYSIGRGKYLTNPKHFLFCIRLLTLYLLQKDISVMTRILEAKISYAENIVGYGKCAIEVDVCETWDRKLSYFLCFKFIYLYVHFFYFLAPLLGPLGIASCMTARRFCLYVFARTFSLRRSH